MYKPKLRKHTRRPQNICAVPPRSGKVDGMPTMSTCHIRQLPSASYLQRLIKGIIRMPTMCTLRIVSMSSNQ